MDRPGSIALEGTPTAQNRLMWMLAIPVVAFGFVWLEPFGSANGLGPDAAREVSSIELRGQVVDRDYVLFPEQKASLVQRLKAFERRTKHQMVVVTVQTLYGADISDFTDALANEWGIGRKGHDDGIVLLVAPSQGKVRISVGDGLKAQLPDDVCATIIEREMIPLFRKNDDAGAIAAGVEAVIRRFD